MDGYEACLLIYNYLNEIEISLHNALLSLQDRLRLRVSSTLLYCLTGDCSPETKQNIAKYPFDGRIETMGVKETQNLLDEILKQRNVE